MGKRNRIKRFSSASDRILLGFSYTILIIFCISIILPFWSVLMDSVSGSKLKIGIRLVPDEFSLSAYKSVLSQKSLLRNYSNTFYRVIFGTILCVLVTYFAAYPLSKRKMPFNRLITYLVLFTMYFSGGLIPQYLLIQNLDLMDNRLVLILPSMFNGFYILIMRNFISEIPAELEESALIDGANDYDIAFKIYMPLLFPIFATVTMWAAVALWNEWFTAMIYIQTPSKQVMQVILRRMLIEAQVAALYEDVNMVVEETEDAIKAVTIIITIIPIICAYPFAQKYFIKGLTSGAVKG